MTRFFQNLGSIWAVKTSRKLFCLTTFCLAVASGASALAATSSSLPAAAQEDVSNGEAAFKNRDYLAAIDHFQQARRAAPTAPEIFFYLGVAESKVPGRELRAISWLAAYLTARADAPNAEAVKNQISALDNAYQKKILSVIRLADDAARSVGIGVYLEGVAEVWAKTGDFTAAMQLVTLMRTQAYRDSAYTHIAESQAKAGNIAGANTTIDLITDPKERHYAQSLVVLIRLAAGDIRGAQETWKSMANLPELSPNEYTWQLAASAIVEAQLAAGDRNGAHKTIATALTNAEIIKSADHRDRVYMGIAEAQARGGDFTGALRNVDLVQDADSRAALRGRVAEAVAESGGIAKALQIADSISDVDQFGFHYQSRARESIAVAQARHGDVAGANKTAALIAHEPVKVSAQKEILEIQKSPIEDKPAVSDWLGYLDEKSRTYSSCPLNTAIFLDLPAHLKSIPPSDDPERYASELLDTIRQMQTARKVIDQLLRGTKVSKRSSSSRNPYAN